RCLRASSERKNGRNDPMTTFQASGTRSGSSSCARLPLSDTGVVKIAGSMFHQPLNSPQKTALAVMVQKATAMGEGLPTSSSDLMCLMASRERKKGRNDPMTTFQASGTRSGSSSCARLPLSDTGVVKIAGSMFHQPLNSPQKTALAVMVQKATAMGEVLPTSR